MLSWIKKHPFKTGALAVTTIAAASTLLYYNKRSSSINKFAFIIKDGQLVSSSLPPDFYFRYHCAPDTSNNKVLTVLPKTIVHERFYPGCHTNQVIDLSHMYIFRYKNFLNVDYLKNPENNLLRVEYVGTSKFKFTINGRPIFDNDD